MADQTEVGVKAQVAYDSWIADMNEDELRAELLEMREGIEVVRDRCARLARNAEAVDMHAIAREMDINAQALAGLLEKDGAK